MSALQFPLTDPARRVAEADRVRILEAPGFGQHFTDFMAHARWTKDAGWAGGELIPFGPLSLSPATAVFHYAQEIFEGLKAFRRPDGSVWTFRPEMNGARFARSARRLALPELPVDDFVESIRALVAADEPWVPVVDDGGEGSLYLRPFMFAAEEFLGVRASQTVDYYVIASPAADYFPRGVQPLVVWVSDSYARAGRGGTGAAKCGGNYASSLLGKYEAIDKGADEVLFLDSETHTRIDELSGMNVFAITKGGEIITPRTSGAILEGVTRDSILAIAQDLGLRSVERDLVLAELTEQIAAGEVVEMFACGTAAVVNPIGELRSKDGAWTIGDGGSGARTMELRKHLTDIQYGRVEDTRGWMTELVPAAS